METPKEARQRAAAAYDAAADCYDHPANSFWARFGRCTIERLRLPRGARVLDVCCGSGASAIPAAEAVGAEGSVLGVDLAENLIALARRKAKSLGLAQASFRKGDLLDLGRLAGEFDAVVCVFGIFFVPDMDAAARELWRLVRSGGALAVTTWGPRLFEPVNTAFWDSVRALRPDLHKAFNPWDRISQPDALRSLLAAAGVTEAEVVAEKHAHPLAAPEDWWRLVMGSGYRGTVEQLEPEDRARVREDCLRFVEANRVRSVEASVVFAVARK
jgi:ubiquinone/menaquinone biosynthesis C-methylase UbiE